MTRPPPSSTLFPYTTLFRSSPTMRWLPGTSILTSVAAIVGVERTVSPVAAGPDLFDDRSPDFARRLSMWASRSEEHTSELQSPCNIVCRLLLVKKENHKYMN